MRRRTLVHATAALTAPGSFRVLAQAPKAGPMRRIAILGAGSDTEPGPPGHRRPNAERLWASVGHVEGQTILIERRFADGNLDRLPDLAGEMLKHDPEVLIAYGDAAVAAARATKTVPIVALFVYEPVKAGLIDSWRRPARNVTGIALSHGIESSHLRLQILRALAPSARRLSLLGVDLRLWTVSGEPFDLASETEAVAASLGFEPTFHFTARTPDDVGRALDAAVAARAQVVSISGSPFIAARRQVEAFAADRRWVSTTLSPDLLNAGLVVYHGPSQAEFGAMLLRMAQLTDRILRGAKPAEMSMELPTRYKLALNLKAARALGLTVPPSVRLQADRVIE
jgi:putative ABC transport system substrate-binding protein